MTIENRTNPGHEWVDVEAAASVFPGGIEALRHARHLGLCPDDLSGILRERHGERRTVAVFGEWPADEGITYVTAAAVWTGAA